MDNLDTLSDDELRRRLIQFGFPNLPVTSTTRKVLVKKLRNYMDTEKSKLRRETSYATRYSSDEEASDREKRSTGGGGGNSARRVRNTIAAVSPTNKYSGMPPPNRASPRAAGSTSAATAAYKLPTRQSPPRGTVYVAPPIHQQQDSDEDSDYNSTSYTSAGGSGNFLSSTRMAGPSKMHADYSYGRTSSCATTPTDVASTNGHAGEDSPYLSNFTKRLLNLRGTTVSESQSRRSEQLPQHRSPTIITSSPNLHSRYLNDSPGILLDQHHNNNNNNHHHNSSGSRPNINRIRSSSKNNNNNTSSSSSSSTSAAAIPFRVAFSHFIYKLDERYGFKQTLVPCMLLSILVVFFALVAFMYVTISPDIANTITVADTTFNLCSTKLPNDPLLPQAHTCIAQEDVEPALDLLRCTVTELQRRIEAHKCVDSALPFTMSANEVIKHAIDKNSSLHVGRTMATVHSMEYLIHMNPQWRISQCDAAGTRIIYGDHLATVRNTYDKYFAILNPRLPFTCSLYNKLQTVFLIVGGLGLSLIGTYACYMIVRYVMNVRRARRELVNGLVADIINALMEKSINFPGQPDATLLVVNHLRDQLIAPAQRQQMDWAWREAIAFLEHNESRVQFEVGMRNGEDCRMMRWIDTVSAHLSPRSSVKKWQSPAFDKTNKVHDPPTPCLKIRQMFDAHEADNAALKQIIQDAILEKVGGKCRIYDIELDAASCCVYVRCATSADAGIVHEQINGWWFDSRLVSIKFLHLDRYLHRFPQSQSGPKVLRPSNSKNLSMSNCNRDKSAEDDDN